MFDVWRSEIPMKIIAANRTGKNKSCYSKSERNTKKKAGLVHHHYSTQGNKQAAENKKIEEPFQYGWFQSYLITISCLAFVESL